MKCNVCGNEFTGFVSRLKADKTYSIDCPICRAYPRHRALVKGFSHLWEGKDIRILHVGPYAPVFQYFKALEAQNPNLVYFPVDERPHINGIHVLDIQRDDHAVAPCDVVICLHVLEHCLYDYKAIETLALGLAETGTAILDIPLKKGKTDRGYGKGEKRPAPAKQVSGKFVKEVVGLILPAEERAKRFEQDNHYRMYGEDDIFDFLAEVGLKGKFVEVPADEEIGLIEPYRFIEATK